MRKNHKITIISLLIASGVQFSLGCFLNQNKANVKCEVNKHQWGFSKESNLYKHSIHCMPYRIEGKDDINITFDVKYRVGLEEYFAERNVSIRGEVTIIPEREYQPPIIISVDVLRIELVK